MFADGCYGRGAGNIFPAIMDESLLDCLIGMVSFYRMCSVQLKEI